MQLKITSININVFKSSFFSILKQTISLLPPKTDPYIKTSISLKTIEFNEFKTNCNKFKSYLQTCILTDETIKNKLTSKVLKFIFMVPKIHTESFHIFIFNTINISRNFVVVYKVRLSPKTYDVTKKKIWY